MRITPRLIILTIQPVDGIDEEECIVRTSPTDTKQKPSKSLVRTLRRFSFIVSAGYQHHRIPDGYQTFVGKCL